MGASELGADRHGPRFPPTYSAASATRASSSSNRSTVLRMCSRAASVAMSTSALSPISARRNCWPSTTVLSSMNAAATWVKNCSVAAGSSWRKPFAADQK